MARVFVCCILLCPSILHPSAVHILSSIAVVPFDAVLIIVINYLILYSRPLGKLVSADIQFLQSRIKRKFLS